MDKKKILIVDDEEDLTTLVKMNLENTGLYEVDVAHDGKAGMAKIKKDKPDLVILDLMMPEKSGFQVLKEVREKKHQKQWRPIILLTAKHAFQDMRKGYDLEADHYITKPFDMDTLLRSIQTVLSLSSIRKMDDA